MPYFVSKVKQSWTLNNLQGVSGNNHLSGGSMRAVGKAEHGNFQAQVSSVVQPASPSTCQTWGKESFPFYAPNLHPYMLRYF